MRRATIPEARELSSIKYFYPRSPCGERPTTLTRIAYEAYISIHALLAESDAASLFFALCYSNFYPRSPCGERLWRFYAFSLFTFYFYPRSPCGERREEITNYEHTTKFLSTLSLRRATPKIFRHCTTYLFLSTLSLRRATRGANRAIQR